MCCPVIWLQFVFPLSAILFLATDCVCMCAAVAAAAVYLRSISFAMGLFFITMYFGLHIQIETTKYAFADIMQRLAITYTHIRARVNIWNRDHLFVFLALCLCV